MSNRPGGVACATGMEDDAVWKQFDRLEEMVALVLLAATTLVIFGAALGRSMGMPVAAGPEIAQMLLIWTCMLGADIVMRRGEHIRVPALSDLLPPGARRLLTLFCVVAMFAFLLILAWLGFKLTISNWARRLGTLDLSYGFVTMALPVGAALMSLSLARRVLSRGIDRALDSDEAGHAAPVEQIP